MHKNCSAYGIFVHEPMVVMWLSSLEKFKFFDLFCIFKGNVSKGYSFRMSLNSQSLFSTILQVFGLLLLVIHLDQRQDVLFHKENFWWSLHGLDICWMQCGDLKSSNISLWLLYQWFNLWCWLILALHHLELICSWLDICLVV